MGCDSTANEKLSAQASDSSKNTPPATGAALVFKDECCGRHSIESREGRLVSKEAEAGAASEAEAEAGATKSYQAEF